MTYTKTSPRYVPNPARRCHQAWSSNIGESGPVKSLIDLKSHKQVDMRFFMHGDMFVCSMNDQHTITIIWKTQNQECFQVNNI